MGSRELLLALCLLAVIEGLLPALAPRRAKAWFAEIAELPAGLLQGIGLALIISGGLGLQLLK